MNGYMVTIRSPKKREGKFYVKRGIILAENMEEGLRLAKDQFREMPGDSWLIVGLEEKSLYMVQ